MKYEFHVGDYVETKDGRVGYVDFYSSSGSYDIYLRTIEKNGYSYSSKMLLMPEITDEELAEKFVRIGQYDFTKNDEDKIEPLSEEYMKSYPITKTFNQEWCSIDIGIIGKKINELVDAVNSIKKELNNG